MRSLSSLLLGHLLLLVRFFILMGNITIVTAAAAAAASFEHVVDDAQVGVPTNHNHHMADLGRRSSSSNDILRLSQPNNIPQDIQLEAMTIMQEKIQQARSRNAAIIMTRDNGNDDDVRLI